MRSMQGDVELSPQSARALSDRLDVVLAFVDAGEWLTLCAALARLCG